MPKAASGKGPAQEVYLANDYAGLDEFGASKKDQPRMRKLVAGEGISPKEQLKNVLSVNFTRVLDLFRDWDEDGNGLLELDEFTRLVRQLQSGGGGGGSSCGRSGERWSDEDIKVAFQRFDTNNSGKMDYLELWNALMGRHMNPRISELAFSHYEELSCFLPALTELRKELQGMHLNRCEHPDSVHAVLVRRCCF